MKNEPGKAGEPLPEGGKKLETPLRRTGRVGLSILNPFSDLGVIYRQGLHPVMNTLGKVWALLNHQSTPSESLNWAQAVERSGRTVEQLRTAFMRVRFAWWCLMVISGGMALVLSALVLLAHDLPSGTLFRAVITILVLTGASALGFVKTLLATYRLWQLQERRVSVSEGGTFHEFLVTQRYVRLAFFLG